MLTEATILQVSSSSQTSPHLRSSTACLAVNPCLRADSGKQDERTDQKAAQAVSAQSGSLDDVKTKLVVARQKVDRDRARWSRLVCEQFS